MQTLDSGIGGDKGFHDYRNFVRVRLPPRLTNPTEQYVDSGMSDAGDPDYSRQSGLDRYFNAQMETISVARKRL